MEHQCFNSHPNSGNSSPTSRELLENDHHRSFDEPPPSNGPKVKLMIRFGGKIELRRHDDQNYSYIGGDTKILTVDRSIKFSNLIEKLSAMTFSNVCLKYQQPGGELDSLISVFNDDDLDSMMFEYDCMCRVSPKPARMKVFLFPLPVNNVSSDSLDSAFNLAVVEDSKSDGQMFVNMLNSVHRPPPVEDLPPPPPPSTMKTSPDYLFGLDNNQAKFPVTEPDFPAKDTECGTETVTEKEIQEIQMVETVNDDEKKVKVNGENDGINGSAEQQVKFDGENGGVEVSSEENTERVIPLVTSEPSAEDPVQEAQPGSFCSCSVQIPEPVSVQSSFTSEMYNVAVAVAGGGYSMGYANEPVPVYLIPTPSGLYQAMRPITGPTGQPVYFAYSPIVNNGGGYSHGSYVANRSALPL